MKNKTGMELVSVELKDVAEDFNPRQDFSKVDEIAKSIQAIGLLQPIVVRRAIGNHAGYILVDGACRLRALRKLGQKETQVLVFDGAHDEAQLASTLIRSGLNWLEKARGYAKLIASNKGKYSAASVARIFGEKKAFVDRILEFAGKFDMKLDVKLVPFLNELRDGDLQVIAQIPLEHQARFMEKFKPGRYDAVEDALEKAFFRLDHSDVFNTEIAAAAKGGFKVKVGYGGIRSYTTDEALFKRTKEAYEALKKKKYGTDQKKQEADAAKQRKAQLALAKKRRQSREAARKLVKDAMIRFMKKSPSLAEVKAAARDACNMSMNTDGMRAVFAAFGVKERKTSEYNQAGARAFDQVLCELVKTPADAVRMHSLLSGIKKFGGASFEEQVVARSRK